MPVSETEIDEVLRELNIVITLQPEGNRSRDFKSFSEMDIFYKKELDFWTESQVGQISGIFSQLAHRLSLVRSSNTLQDVRNRLNDFLQLERANKLQIAYSQTTFSQTLAALQKSYPAAIPGALNYRQPGPLNLNAVGIFDGMVAASLSCFPQFIDLAIQSDRAAFQKNSLEIDEYRRGLRDEFQRFKSDAGAWTDAAQKDLASVRLSAESDLQKTNRQGAEQLQTLHSDWSERLNKSNGEWEQKFADLERTYADKLRLEAPAQYWKDLQESYGRAGTRWVWVSVSTAIAIAIVAALLLYCPASVLLGPPANGGKEPGFSLAGLRGTLLVALIISAGIYLLHLFVKLATSDFHLQRDATERYHLTLVFLGLSKDSKVDVEDRKIVLQSLFSRADTGLLKNDGGVTMPGLAGIWDLVKGK